MKNYINFVNDHSGSMGHLAQAAAKDYNANIAAVKDSATREMLDTVVSVAEVCFDAKLSVTVSNPHVLKPITSWKCNGGTPLWTMALEMITMLLTLPDAKKPDVSFLVMMTTDGDATDGPQAHARLKAAMAPLLADGRWSFVVRIPQHASATSIRELKALGISDGNIQRWDTTAAGMEASTQATTQAMSGYFRARTAGAKSTGSFYADASQVNLAVLEDLSKKVSLYVVPMEQNGIEIRDFILKHRMEYLKGAAFYQLTKTESKVSHTKHVLIRERVTGKVYGGAQARQMINLPTDRNARLHPGDHKNFDLFIQSESVNRKLVAGTGVIYHKEIGVPFTAADLAYLQPKVAPQSTSTVVLPAVPVSTKPTKSPIRVTPRFSYFETREESRQYCAAHGIPQRNVKKNMSAPKERRWFV